MGPSTWGQLSPPPPHTHPSPRKPSQVDVQGTVGLLGSAAGGGAALSDTYHASLEASARAFFPGNHLINCMCHDTANLYR